MMTGNPRLFDFSSDGPIPYVMRQKLTSIPTPSPGLSLSGKTVLVTGATSGVGYEAARQLARLGAKLVMGVRNLQRAEAVKQEFLGEIPEASIEAYQLDMESLDSVDRFVKRLSAEATTLDIALLNAGLFTRDERRVDGGWSHLMQVNFRSTAYLALCLVPLLRPKTDAGSPTSGAQPGRLVLVSSEAHAWSTYQIPTQGDILSEFQQDGVSVRPDFEYYAAKLFLALFGRELAARLDPAELEVVTTTPGFCASGFFPDAASIPTRLIYLTSARSLSQGGRLHVHAATCAGSSLSGKYLRDGHVNKLSPYAESDQGRQLQARLWGEMTKLCASRGVELDSGLRQA
ncbi:short chain dehydrogenase [Hirsutella rhossiliensis]|uniref:Short chain dehydrogenase domain-containing protein n=1 Tax=Hirsutella rhossiliensis TaxID=111463 RepID=A0A9P8N2R1_9HYPO|nr:short chain dehydrogenase domain-containing protein [Hirsutella rhossiliensis]KAH0965542.1 short chain dehydrogenase domain-containing protein [Hirsutella rhossiliensis]